MKAFINILWAPFQYLTYWGRDKMAAVFSSRHSRMHFLEWKLLNFLKNFIDICSLGSNWQYSLVQIMGCHRTGDKPLSESVMVWLPGAHYVTRPQVNWWTHTETEMSSFWWNFHHWLHWKLSNWQLPVQPVIKISSKWRHFRFSDRCVNKCGKCWFNQQELRH